VQKLVIATLLAWMLLASPAYAQQPATLDQVLSKLDALTRRVEKLENDNAGLVSENAQLKQSNTQLEATVEGIRANPQPSKETADTAQKVAALEKNDQATDWASRITWKGDFRYRHEQVQPEESDIEDKRQRIRARFGLTAKVNDKVSATVALATGVDPRSTNQTLTDGMNRKTVGIDLAYGDWKPINGLTVLMGKTPYPWTRVGGSEWDPDITWEGTSVHYEHGAFFGTAMGSWLSNSTGAKDVTLFGGQVGMKGEAGGAKLLGAIGYFDIGGAEGEITTASTGCTANTAFFGGAQGNSTFTDANGCARLANDFNIVEAIGQAEFKVGHYPVTAFVDYLQNLEADDFETGYSIGAYLGKAAEPHTWEVGYYYQLTEKDSQFGQFMESDFGGGITDTKGSVFKFGYAIAKNWIANATYFLNERFVDVGDQSDYDRWQLDLNYKFQ